jgi:hypothetical protein
MPITISGSTGIAGVDGSASTPAVQGTDTNTGIFFPAADTIAFGEGGSEAMRIDSSGNVGIGTSSPGDRLQVSGGNLSVLGATGSTFTGFVNQNTGASASAYRCLFYDGLNENSIAVANMLVDVNTDGSSGWLWSTTPAGSRTSDRRVDRVRITGDGNLQFNSGYGSAATAYGCRAWVNFNGTGTVAIRASGNVTSITDNGTGDYTVNFTNAMPDANYSSVGACAKNDNNNDGNQTVQVGGFSGSLQTASACRIRTVYITGFSAQDSPQVTFAAFR